MGKYWSSIGGVKVRNEYLPPPPPPQPRLCKTCGVEVGERKFFCNDCLTKRKKEQYLKRWSPTYSIYLTKPRPCKGCVCDIDVTKSKNHRCDKCKTKYEKECWTKWNDEKYEQRHCKTCGVKVGKYKHFCSPCREKRDYEKYLVKWGLDIPRNCKECGVKVGKRFHYCSDCLTKREKEQYQEWSIKNHKQRYCKECGVEVGKKKILCDGCLKVKYPQRHCEDCGVKVGKKKHFCNPCLIKREHQRLTDEYIKKWGIQVNV